MQGDKMANQQSLADQLGWCITTALLALCCELV